MIIDLMVTDSLERFYPYSTASFYIYSITYLEYSLLFAERMLFVSFFAGRSKLGMHLFSGNSLDGEGIKYKYLMAVRAIFS